MHVLPKLVDVMQEQFDIYCLAMEPKHQQMRTTDEAVDQQ